MRNQRKLASLVVHRVQREVTLLVVVAFMVVTLCTAFLVHWTLHQAVEQAGHASGMGGTIEVLLIFKRTLLDRIFLALLLAIFAVAFVVVKRLDRVAGPINRIAQTLHEIGEGRVPKEIKLRERDYLSELAEEVNGVIRYVRSLDSEGGRKRL